MNWVHWCRWNSWFHANGKEVLWIQEQREVFSCPHKKQYVTEELIISFYFNSFTIIHLKSAWFLWCAFLKKNNCVILVVFVSAFFSFFVVDPNLFSGCVWMSFLCWCISCKWKCYLTEIDRTKIFTLSVVLIDLIYIYINKLLRIFIYIYVHLHLAYM